MECSTINLLGRVLSSKGKPNMFNLMGITKKNISILGLFIFQQSVRIRLSNVGNAKHEHISKGVKILVSIDYRAAPYDNKSLTGCGGCMHKMPIEPQPTTLITINPKERN